MVISKIHPGSSGWKLFIVTVIEYDLQSAQGRCLMHRTLFVPHAWLWLHDSGKLLRCVPVVLQRYTWECQLHEPVYQC